MKEKIKKIWINFTDVWCPYLILCLAILILIGIPTILWDYGKSLYQKVFGLICYIPIGILAGMKFWELFQKYAEMIDRKKYQRYQKYIEECKKKGIPVTKSRSEFSGSQWYPGRFLDQ